MDVEPGEGVLGGIGGRAVDEGQQGLDDLERGGGAGLVQVVVVGEGGEAAGEVGGLLGEEGILEEEGLLRSI